MISGPPNATVAFSLLQWCASRTISDALGPGGQGIAAGTRAFLKSRQIDSLYTIAAGKRDKLQEASDLVWGHQLTALREALEALAAAGVRVLTFKGGELIPRHFPRRSLGITADLDLLVPRDEIELARSVLYKLDFRHQFLDKGRRVMADRDVADVAEIELHHYELAPMARTVPLDAEPALRETAASGADHRLYLDRGRPVAIIEIDLHHNVASDADPGVFFSRAVPGAAGAGETFSPADHVWFNLSRCYNEVGMHGKLSLRPIAYTLPEVASGRVDWTVVEHMADELTLGPTLYYLLGLCDRLAPGHVPASTLVAVKESTASRVRDWGWQLGKLFDFDEEFPSYAFLETAQPQPAALTF